MINRSLLLTYLYLLIYITLSSGVILYNKWVLSPKYFNFPFPITLTMIHMGFSGAVAFFLIRVFKVVTPVKMTFRVYATCVIPISAFFASSLWFGNTAYLHISVAFIQMLKALMPVATFVVAVLWGTDKLRWDVFLNMVLVSVGVVISSYGEIHFNVIGTVYQVTGIFAEALRLVLTQVLLQKKGLTLNPITSLYYIAPCSFVFLFVPWYFLEKPGMEVSQIQFNFWIFFSNAICALLLNFSIFLVIGRTGAVTVRVAGVLKDWILIALSTVIFPESTITGLNIIGYAIALCGVVLYNYLKVKEVRASQTPESIPDRITKEWKLEKKSSDLYTPDSINDDNGSGSNASNSDFVMDEEAPSFLRPGCLILAGHSKIPALHENFQQVKDANPSICFSTLKAFFCFAGITFFRFNFVLVA
ncbi:UNVERIFIED_CONTAM: putative sugar phosphate/phosphate translocator [Sesamum calycinum]|uniref:Sugar phosphate/phosphate translocator n=1 Tax=Sesamum calycinum TaxID=2727403 RepID=A0AAW2QK10_9LAMI